ncbi:MAG: hypothetical protein H5T86_09805, partial [Armatimonadetes bacterium]|nr:hypothetical protein [Armatimonadota bacterium]
MGHVKLCTMPKEGLREAVARLLSVVDQVIAPVAAAEGDCFFLPIQGPDDIAWD